ncbi:MAG: C69 family dipeptidase [Deltaproteobacteria bacterium]|nr:C69 family dipeptidase [Candidatus Zymogenaceae bacterium]
MCDTIVATASATADGSVLFGKNSDREPNEAQPIEYHPAKEYKKGESLRCTYIEIPQVQKTRAVLISRPAWIWGAEIGTNESGVSIGNEAVFTKLTMSLEKRLLGMDLLRLALERADTAEDALTVITKLLSEYGQGGPCGFEDKKLAYHNSFIIADPNEAWVLETADTYWAALKVDGVYSISNGITIGNRLDKASPGLVEHAIEEGWCKSEDDFHFGRCYSDWFFTTFSMCKPRGSRSFQLLEKAAPKITPGDMMTILRDHGEGDGEFRPERGFFMNKVCMHAANGLSRNSQSTASMVSHLTGGINTHWVTGTSAPCTSVFKPFFFEAKELPGGTGDVGETYSEDSAWWRHERLHRAVLRDYPTMIKTYREERDGLEESFIAEATEAVDGSSKGGAAKKGAALRDLSRSCFKRANDAEETWTKRVEATKIEKRAGGSFGSYWKKQNRKAKIPGMS